jgi:AcrR family transcriptional regulator
MEHRQRRQYILECAEKLFAEKGFDKVTVADIAKASEFSVGSLYLFFESKESLIHSLLLERLNQVFELIRVESARSIPAVEKLENISGGILSMFIEHIDFFKVHVREVRGAELCGSTETFAEFSGIFSKSLELLAGVFRQGIDEGSFRDDIEPLHMAFFLDAGLHSLFHYINFTGKTPALDKAHTELQEILFHGILKADKGKAK